jgi:hypothetical protein
VREVTTRETELEDIFLRLTNEPEAGEDRAMEPTLVADPADGRIEP